MGKCKECKTYRDLIREIEQKLKDFHPMYTKCKWDIFNRQYGGKEVVIVCGRCIEKRGL